MAIDQNERRKSKNLTAAKVNGNLEPGKYHDGGGAGHAGGCSGGIVLRRKTDQSEDRRRGRDPPCSRDGQTGTHSAASR